jgi:hypothetical protein
VPRKFSLDNKDEDTFSTALTSSLDETKHEIYHDPYSHDEPRARYITLVTQSISSAILCTCRLVNTEATVYVRAKQHRFDTRSIQYLLEERTVQARRLLSRTLTPGSADGFNVPHLSGFIHRCAEEQGRRYQAVPVFVFSIDKEIFHISDYRRCLEQIANLHPTFKVYILFSPNVQDSHRRMWMHNLRELRYAKQASLCQMDDWTWKNDWKEG